MMSTANSSKFQIKASNPLSPHPVMIIGQNPGRQRKAHQTGVVWEGNRSGDFITEVCEDYGLDNVILTNVCNYQEMTAERIEEGLNDIVNMTMMFQVRKFVCLGDFAYNHLKTIGVDPIKLEHPSFILRFNRNREEYINRLVKAVRDDDNRP